ncbi:MAG: hypothetical protein HC855_15840 [Rhizobiales bacterium]|nr:hypothetical protein [Hyphomicrobiales bacterium]
MATRLNCCNEGCYLDRAPERLVLQGYRQWMGGYDTACVACWERASDLYVNELGARAAGPIVLALGQWVRMLRHLARRHLNAFPGATHRLCRDECLVMALIAACQHSDEGSYSRVIKEIVHDQSDRRLLSTAKLFADALNECGLRMLPIPLNVIEDILTQPERETYY